MFERQTYKKQAKNQLAKYWKTPILVCLVHIGIFIISYALTFRNQILMGRSLSFTNNIASVYTAFIPMFSFYILFALIINGIMEAAQSNFFILFVQDRDKANFAAFLEGFNLWLRGILGLLWRTLWVTLWCLLFYIPAIIKSLAYSQLFYILADNPNIGVRRALRISMAITKGYKGDIFIMHLSFIGWFILTFFSLGIGLLWLLPYMRTTLTYTYQYLKTDALNRGIITAADLS